MTAEGRAEVEAALRRRDVSPRVRERLEMVRRRRWGGSYGLRWTHGAACYLFVHTTLYFAVILLVLWVTGDLSWPVWRRGLAVVFAIATFLATSFLFLVAYGRVPGAPRDEPSQSSADTVPDVESNGTLLRTTYCGGHMH